MVRTYQRLLAGRDEADFIEACDRILWEDEWFPTIARLNAMIDQCANDRERHDRAAALTTGRDTNGGLVCGRCKGARWLRDGLHRDLVACPGCMYDGKYSPLTESATIARSGGVIPEGAEPRGIADFKTLHAPFRKADGSFDGEALYAYSREIRGLDPTKDDRPRTVAGWTPIGRVAA